MAEQQMKIRRSRDIRALIAQARYVITGRKVFEVGDTVQFGNALYRVSFWGPFGHVILRDDVTGKRVGTGHAYLGNVRLIRKHSHRPGGAK